MAQHSLTINSISALVSVKTIVWKYYSVLSQILTYNGMVHLQSQAQMTLQMKQQLLSWNKRHNLQNYFLVILWPWSCLFKQFPHASTWKDVIDT